MWELDSCRHHTGQNGSFIFKLWPKLKNAEVEGLFLCWRGPHIILRKERFALVFHIVVSDQKARGEPLLMSVCCKRIVEVNSINFVNKLARLHAKITLSDEFFQRPTCSVIALRFLVDKLPSWKGAFLNVYRKQATCLDYRVNECCNHHCANNKELFATLSRIPWFIHREFMVVHQHRSCSSSTCFDRK